MTIIYAVICRAKDAAVLTEVCDKDVKGTFGSVMVELLQHLRDHPELFQDGDLKTFVQKNQAEIDFFSHFLEACSAALGDEEEGSSTSEHYFHLFFKDGVFYCCLGDDADTRDQKVNFAFLHHIQEEFVKMHRAGRIKTAHAYALDKNFAPTMRAAMHYHNVHHKEIRQEEKVTRLLAQVQDIRDVMGRNLNMILERGAQFDGLLLKTEVVTADAQVFKKKAKIAAEKIERKSYFWTAVLAFIVFVFLYMTVVSMCGVRLNSCRKSSSSSSNGGNGSSGGSSGSSGGNAGG